MADIELDFFSIRRDWFANGDLMARKIKSAISDNQIIFLNFPLHWIVLFEYCGVRWCGVSKLKTYIPFFVNLNEEGFIHEIEMARSEGQLRLLLESIASSDIILCETLQRLNFSTLLKQQPVSNKDIRLCNWHSYFRPEMNSLAEALEGFVQKRENVIFLPCGRKRPYNEGQGFKKLVNKLSEKNIYIEDCDQVVVTSLGFIPQEQWNHSIVMRYDTGIRDIYRMLVMGRKLFKNSHYKNAIDCMNFQPYRDLIQILHRENFFDSVERPIGLKNRNILAYR